MNTAIASAESLSAAELDQLSINTIRTLSIDAVQKAKSGHPGTPMAPRLLSIRSGIVCSNSIRKIRSGPIEIVSCYRTDTPLCCSGPLFISAAFKP